MDFVYRILQDARQYLQLVFGTDTLLYHSVVAVISVIVIVGIGKVIKIFFQNIVSKLFRKTKSDLDDVILMILNERIIAISTILGLYVGINEIEDGITSHHTSIIAAVLYSRHALYVASVIIITTVVIKITKLVLNRALRNIMNDDEQIDQSLGPLMNRVISIAFITIALIVILDHFGQNITSVITLLGAGSLAIGLAAQDTISNMISGFIIMIDRPFRIGDRIKVPTGEVGDIFEIGIRSTKILDFDNNLIIVPNNELIKTRVINYGYPAGEIRVVVDIGVAYGSDIEQIKSILIATARRHPLVLAEPAPEAYLMNFADSSILMRLVCRVASFRDQFTTTESLRVNIYNAFRDLKIEIPFPQRVVHIATNDQNAAQSSPKKKGVPRNRR